MRGTQDVVLDQAICGRPFKDLAVPSLRATVRRGGSSRYLDMRDLWGRNARHDDLPEASVHDANHIRE